MIAYTFHGVPADKTLETNHIDGNYLNDNANNLEWVTKARQMEHAYTTGLLKPNKFAVKLVHIHTRETHSFESNVNCLGFLKNKGVKTNWVLLKQLLTNRGTLNDFQFFYQDASMYEEIVQSLEGEEWKSLDIDSRYDRIYQVSNRGRFKTIHKNGREQIKKTYEKCKFQYIKFVINGKPKHLSVSKIVAQKFVHPRNLTIIHHLNGDKMDNNAANLHWVKNVKEIMSLDSVKERIRRGREEHAAARELHRIKFKHS